MASKEKRNEWERMGLCTHCGGLKLEPEFRMCAKCRAKSRENVQGIYWREKQPIAPEKPKVLPEIRKNHKCWNCEWRKFEGDRFFCPFVEGTCVKDGTLKIGLDEEVRNED